MTGSGAMTLTDPHGCSSSLRSPQHHDDSLHAGHFARQLARTCGPYPATKVARIPGLSRLTTWVAHGRGRSEQCLVRRRLDPIIRIEHDSELGSNARLGNMPEKRTTRSTRLPAKIGRPSKYSDEWAQSFCEMIAQGKSVPKICEDERQPTE